MELGRFPRGRLRPATLMFVFKFGGRLLGQHHVFSPYFQSLLPVRL